MGPFVADVPERLQGERIALRRWRETDVQPLWEAVHESADVLRPWMPWVTAYTSPAAAREFIERATMQWNEREALFMAIVDQESDLLLGGTGFDIPDWRLRKFEIGYWLRGDAVGKGYVSDAVRLLTECAFERFAARRVEIRCDPRNLRSRRVAERAGYDLEGHLRNHQLDGEGQPRDTLVFALTDGDWRARRAGG
jgi:RimJ/RimL family protein N-acetyltransferase